MSICIYHGNCADGFSAAWSVWKVHPDWDFHAGVYQTTPPDVNGKDVVLVDFSYKRPVLLDIASKAKSVLILDHHKSAMEDLEGISDEAAKLGWFNVQTIFDMNHSGAVLAWKHFHPDSAMPTLLAHVEDRDLWRFKLDGTREIQAAVFSYPYDFEIWDELMRTPTEKLREQGVAIERKHFKDIHELIKVTSRRMTIAGFDVPVASLPYTMSSDAGHIMGENEPFAACYWDTVDGRVFSLRSADNGEDVSKIAVQFGGGGHQHAAGFKVPREHSLAVQ